MRRRSAAEDQLGIGQLVERLAQFLHLEVRDRAQQLEWEPPADGGGGLRHLAHRRQTVEPGRQRIVHGRRDGDRGDRAGELVVVAGGAQQAQLEHGLGQLLHEERHAVGLLQDLVEHLLGQRLVAADLLHKRRALAPAEPAQRQLGDVALADPGRRELGAEGQQQQSRYRAYPLDQLVDELQRRGVGPMDILEQHERRPPAGQRLELIEQDLERKLLLALRREVERRIAPLGRDRQQGRGQRDRLFRVQARTGSRAGRAWPRGRPRP